MDPGWINHQDTGFWSLSPPQFLRLLATPRLTGRGNAWPSGASVRFPSLSWPVLAIDATTKHSSGPDTHPQCQPASTSPAPHSSLSPSPLPGWPKAGLPARPPGRPSLGCSKENPLEVLGATCPRTAGLTPAQSNGSWLDQRRDLQ